MKFRNKKIFCVGNAHLDPLWLWQWPEGSCESKATIRSALDRMKEYPDFKFCCAAGVVFEWIEKFDPDMFAEIQQRVQEGRFILTGGWYVQPDCNNPGGESFARHGLYTQRYFLEKFGTTAKVGYNVDSFGHHVMIPQFLRKQGMDNYIFMRPGSHEKVLPSHIFRWQSPDGSEVLAGKILIRYNYSGQMNDREGFEAVIAAGEEQADPNMDQMLLFYGVGNHGGGPTKKNIEAIIATNEAHAETEFVFSNASDFFARANTFREKLPLITDDLQHHASGCYAAVSAVKREIRRAECELFEAENFGMLVQRRCGRNGATTEQLKQAWKNVLFSHFHDSMGGCSVRAAHDDTLLQLGESRSAAQRMKNDALQTLSWQIDTRNTPLGNPCVIFNPHPFPVRQLLELNSVHDHVYNDKGEEIPTQTVHGESGLTRAVGGNTVFMAEVPALGYTTYYRAKDISANVDTWNAYRADPEAYKHLRTQPVPENHPKAEGCVLENNRLRVEFERHTGYIKAITDKETGREYLRGYGALPVVIDEMGHDTWSHAKNFFDKEIGQFTDGEVTVLENGPVRATIMVRSYWGKSCLEQKFSLLPDSKQLEVRCRLDWHEKRKMLKLRFQTALSDPKAYYEIPYGVMERPCDGEEEPGLMWIAAKDEAAGFAILNDSKYSFSIKGGEMNLTAIRSPFYNDHGREGAYEDPENELTDQGMCEFKYAFCPVEGEGWNGLIRKARSFNIPCTKVDENRHKGVLDKTYSGICVDAPNVLVCALKRSEDGTGTVLRAYETDGKEAVATFTGDLLPAPLTAKFTPWSINTYYLKDGDPAWREVLMTELDV